MGLLYLYLFFRTYKNINFLFHFLVFRIGTADCAVEMMVFGQVLMCDD